MSDNFYGVSGPDASVVRITPHQFTDEGQTATLHEGAAEFSRTALNQASQLGRGSAEWSFDSTVRDLGRRVDSSIRAGMSTARNAIEQGVNWTGQQIHAGAEYAREQLPGDSTFAQQTRDTVTSAENKLRFGVGVIGGISREAVSLAEAGVQLSSTATQMLLSPTKRQEVTDSVVTSIANGANTAYEYGASVVSNPDRLTGDLAAVYDAGRNTVNNVIERHQQAIEQGRGPETLGMTTGQALTYVVPFGGGPARTALTGTVRESGELLAREGAETLARQSTRIDALASSGVSQASGDVFHSIVNHTSRSSSADFGVNFFRTSELRRHMAQSPIGQKILNAADSGLIDIEFNAYNLTTPLEGVARGNKAHVYLRNTQNGTTYPMLGLKLNGYEHSAAVAVHEGVHALGVGGSRRAEALARLAELEHLGVPITTTAMRQVLTDMGQNYSHLPWQVGASSPHFSGVKF